MVKKQEILIVAEKNGFLPRAIAEQLESYGYQVIMKEPAIQSLFDFSSACEAMLIYLEGELLPHITGYSLILLTVCYIYIQL